MLHGFLNLCVLPRLQSARSLDLLTCHVIPRGGHLSRPSPYRRPAAFPRPSPNRSCCGGHECCDVFLPLLSSPALFFTDTATPLLFHP